MVDGERAFLRSICFYYAPHLRIAEFSPSHGGKRGTQLAAAAAARGESRNPSA